MRVIKSFQHITNQSYFSSPAPLSISFIVSCVVLWCIVERTETYRLFCLTDIRNIGTNERTSLIRQGRGNPTDHLNVIGVNIQSNHYQILYHRLFHLNIFIFDQYHMLCLFLYSVLLLCIALFCSFTLYFHNFRNWRHWGSRWTNQTQEKFTLNST